MIETRNAGKGCRNIHLLIQAYLDGEASAGERGRVEHHVAGCPACARELESSRQLRQMLSGSEERAVSDSFERRLMARVQARERASGPAAWWERFRLRSEWRLRIPALVTAGSLAAALVAAFVTVRVQDVRTAQQERQEFVSTAVQRYQQLQSADSKVNWDAVEASIELNSGSLVTE